MVKHTETICRQKPTNCLCKTVKHTEIIPRQKPTNYSSVFEQFVELALKGLISMVRCAIWYHVYNFKSEKHPWKSVTFSKAAG